MERHLVARTTPALVPSEHVGQRLLTSAHGCTCYPPWCDFPSTLGWVGGCSVRLTWIM